MRYSRWLAALLVGCLATLVAPAVARADQILPVDGGWQAFNWDKGVGSSDKEGAFTFTAFGQVTLKVTDAYVPGDQFAVFDFGHSIGTTTLPNAGGPWTPNPDVAYGSIYFSWGAFLLGAGPHSITLQTINIAPGYSAGTGYLRADSNAVVASLPEPATAVLAAVGGAVILGYRRWRRRALAPAA
jgi:hypothetical protein